MSAAKAIELMSTPLNPAVGLLLMLVGGYSLYVNVNVARRSHYRRSERVARIGGWVYLLAGAVILITQALG